MIIHLKRCEYFNYHNKHSYGTVNVKLHLDNDWVLYARCKATKHYHDERFTINLDVDDNDNTKNVVGRYFELYNPYLVVQYSPVNNKSIWWDLLYERMRSATPDQYEIGTNFWEGENVNDSRRIV